MNKQLYPICPKCNGPLITLTSINKFICADCGYYVEIEIKKLFNIMFN